MASDSKLERFARGAALRARVDDTPTQKLANLFDDVQELALHQEAAGEFEEAPTRSLVDGPWTWRAYLHESLEDEELFPKPAMPTRARTAHRFLPGYL